MSPMRLNRRSVLGLLGASTLARFSAATAQTPASAKVTLLGTAGGPPPHLQRSQPASLLEVAGKVYLIDAGENVAQQLLRAGSAPQKVNALFLTHLHWDHTLGLGYLLATGWMMGRGEQMPIWGPPGTQDLVARTTREVQLGEDIFRVQAAGRPSLAGLYRAHEITRDSVAVLFEDGTVSVSAAANTHFAQLRAPRHSYGEDKCYSYRFDTPQGAVVFTGDTGPSDAVAQLAKGAAVLVAEITDLDSIRVALQQAGNSGAVLDTLMQHMEHQHLTAMEVGKLATAANAGKLVLSHFVVGRGFDPETFVSQIRPYYKGEIVVGKDLATVTLT
jgi:ribonuclease BN (tRNA processing enzyme)